MAGVGHGITPTGVILMGVGAAQAQGPAVEEKSLVAREPKPAKTRPDENLIHGPAVIDERHPHRITVRMIGMPKQRVGEHQFAAVRRQRLPGGVREGG